MLLSLLRFEVFYQLKQKAFIGFSLLFLAFGYLLGQQGFTPANVHFNAPYQINFTIALLTLGVVFAIMFFAVSGMLRDERHAMAPIVYSTAVRKRDFYWSRFFGIFIFSLLVFSLSLLGFGLGVSAPHLDPERLGGFQFTHYLWTWLVIVLPNVLICTTIIFTVAALAKNTIATYAAAVFIYGAYFICSIFFNSPLMANSVPADPENMAIAALADPFGLAAFFEQTQYWTAFQKNAQLISFSGYFMWNRILWTGCSILLLGLTFRLFSFRKWNKKVKQQQQSDDILSYSSYQSAKIIAVQGKAQRESFWSLLKMELANTFKSLPFIAMVLVWIVIVITEIYPRINQGGAYNDSLYPTTNLFIWLIQDPLPLISLLLILFFSGEMVWRERSIRLSGIIDATPVSNASLFLSKAVALVLLPVLLTTLSIIIAIGFQVTKGYYNFELSQYLSLYYYTGIGSLFYILLALFMQSLIPHKYAAMVLTGLIILTLGSSLAVWIGIEYPLFRIGSMPKVTYTNMTAYGDYSRPFHCYAIYWLSFGGVLALLSFKLWQRGSIDTWNGRLRQLLANWKRWQMISLVLIGVVFIASGATIYYNTSVLNEFTTAKEELDLWEAYERKYRAFTNLPNLGIVDKQSNIDIYPSGDSIRIKADCMVENLGDSSLNKVLISKRVTDTKLHLENATILDYDSLLETYTFQIDPPLLPGQQLQFSYEVKKVKQGFERSRHLVSNGSYIFSHTYEPSLEYRESMEIQDNFERKKRGLAMRAAEPHNADHLHSNHSHDFKKMGFEAILSTQADQIAIAPGRLVRSWKESGRNYFHYKATNKIAPGVVYISGNYAVQKKQFEGVSIEQYYHPPHTYNIDHIEQSTQAALTYCSQHFGPYPYDHLRIVEIPGHWPFGGQAKPGLISMVEDRLYLIDNRSPEGFDLIAKRTIHEVAHQWWGHLLTPKYVEGGSLFTEGFAKYTEAVVMEQLYGKGAIWQLSEIANRRYFSGRAFAADTEPPLYLSAGEGYLSYGKNFIAMLALLDLIGEEPINQVLRQLVEKHRDTVMPQAVSTEWLKGLYQVAPQEYHRLIDDWFKRIITYDLKVTDATIKELDNGNYQVQVSVQAKRFEQQANGAMQAIPIDEPIPIGLFAKHPQNIHTEQEIIYLQPHRLQQEKAKFTLEVKKHPQYIAIDPFGTRLDENRIDNIDKLEE